MEKLRRFKGKKPRDWGGAYKSLRVIQDQQTLTLYSAETSSAFFLGSVVSMYQLNSRQAIVFPPYRWIPNFTFSFFPLGKKSFAMALVVIKRITSFSPVRFLGKRFSTTPHIRTLSVLVSRPFFLFSLELFTFHNFHCLPIYGGKC